MWTGYFKIKRAIAFTDGEIDTIKGKWLTADKMPHNNKQVRTNVNKTQLKIGGRLFAVLGKTPPMHATLFTRESETKWTKKRLFETILPELPEISGRPGFEF